METAVPDQAITLPTFLAAGIAEKVTRAHEIHEQYGRREARRKAGFGLWGEVSGSTLLQYTTNTTIFDIARLNYMFIVRAFQLAFRIRE